MTGYAVTFNLIHQRSGHLFQNRYRSIICNKDEYLLELVRYIHLNPVRAGLVKTIEELDHYPWTGHSVLMGYQRWEGQEVDEILGFFSGGRGRLKGRQEYHRFIADGLEMGHCDDFSGIRQRGRIEEGGENKGLPILGDNDFVKRVLRDRVLLERRQALWTFIEFLKKISKIIEVDVEELRRPSKNRVLADARGVVCYIGMREFGYKGMDIGRELNLGSGGVSRALRRDEIFLSKNSALKQRILEELVK